MTEHDLEKRLRAGFRDAVDRTAPLALRSNVQDIPDIVPITRRLRLTSHWGLPMNRVAPVALVATAVTIALLAGVSLLMRPSPDVGPPSPPDPTHARATNGWIAYSTAPADYEGPIGDASFLVGSDIYLVREGEEPRLIADRDDGETWNVCPAFSPDGRMLAFGQETRTERAIVVSGVSTSGSITEPNLRIAIAGAGLAPCPRWSSDGTRVAYVQDGAVVVRGLDSSSAAMTDGDPELADFTHGRDSIASPSGQLIARDVGGTIVVERADGSDSRIVAQFSAYALAGWSPDGRWILSMQDVSGFHFTMHATSIDEPFETVAIVERVRVNHGRSWPGDGDVSWQPVYP